MEVFVLLPACVRVMIADWVIVDCIRNRSLNKIKLLLTYGWSVEVDWRRVSPTRRNLGGPLLRYYPVTGVYRTVQRRAMTVWRPRNEQLGRNLPVIQVVFKAGRGGTTEATIRNELGSPFTETGARRELPVCWRSVKEFRECREGGMG